MSNKVLYGHVLTRFGFERSVDISILPDQVMSMPYHTKSVLTRC